jgi:hypothetical protein
MKFSNSIYTILSLQTILSCQLNEWPLLYDISEMTNDASETIQGTGVVSRVSLPFWLIVWPITRNKEIQLYVTHWVEWPGGEGYEEKIIYRSFCSKCLGKFPLIAKQLILKMW